MTRLGIAQGWGARAALVAGGAVLVVGPALVATGRVLDAFAFGDTTASALGVNVAAVRWAMPPLRGRRPTGHGGCGTQLSTAPVQSRRTPLFPSLPGLLGSLGSSVPSATRRARGPVVSGSR